MTRAGTGTRQVAGVVAAAGSSVRMGRRNKLLLEVGGEAMVRRVASTALQGGLDPVTVVTGHDREAVEAGLADLPCRLVHNPHYAEGLHTSVAIGVAHAARDHQTSPTPLAAVVVLLADMPFATPDMLRAIVARHRETGALAVVSRYASGQTAPPVLYDCRLFSELTALDAGGGRALLRRHRARTVRIQWAAEAAWDVDRPEDYARVRARLQVMSSI